MGQPAKKLDTSSTSIIGNTVRPFGMRDKLGYMFGDWGNDFFFILAASFLMVFYTDVYHISPALVGTLFLVARLWDAIADVTVGRFIDSRKAGKNGKFRPWIFRMSFPLVIVGVLMFVHIPGMSTGFYEAYAFITYLLWGTLYSTVNIPYGSMASVMTSDPVERTTLSTFRSLGGALAGLIINVAGPLILFVDNKADANRFILGAIIFGILSLTCYMACYKLTVERIVAPESETPKGNFAQTVKGLGKNKPLLWILVASLLFLVCFMLVGTVNVYLFKDYFSNAKALSMVGLIQTVALIIAMPMVKPLVAKFGKKELASGGLFLSIIVYTLLYFLPNLTAGQFTGVLAVGMFGFSFFNLVIWAFVTDVIDYHEYLTGLREDGTVYSIYSFARKVGQAVAGGLGGYAIAAVGYNSTSQSQTQEALSGIHSLATLVPAVILLVVFLILVFFYPLNKKRTMQLTADLAERRKVQN
ncbi:sugar (glycoside-Pentoside-Hexuronide) transporter [Neobacillus bataviensis LMG 21833]|uniref:Sugar (Glycoside-Pentoside-Hexuronide) transporter n=1 Tax=Neobacillus bataviensis LMG 21833 TaxID=1117379 RepID=K6CQH1_9BACI|nr:MFS transporter [Neobacillus bataviensis]EKN62482.1 sugar (glycoside-Pentoside-Hexuronide) transporter [Neobacillus bataviensis LMG 21833]